MITGTFDPHANTSGDFKLETRFSLLFGEIQKYRSVFTVLPPNTAYRFEVVENTGVAGTDLIVAKVTATSNNSSFMSRRIGNGGYTMSMFINDVLVGSISHPTTTSTAFNTTSDRRLKSNIVPLVGSLGRICQLNPYSYEFRSDPGVEHRGFIADEVQSIVPLAVTGLPNATDENGEPIYQQLDLSKLVPDLVAAIQELSHAVKDLKRRVDKLEEYLVLDSE